MTSAPGEVAAGGGVRLLPLLTAIAITLGVTVYPQFLAAADGQADHGAALAACWAMAAGYVSGVGFRPRLWPLRVAFSGWAVLAGLLVALARLGG